MARSFALQFLPWLVIAAAVGSGVIAGLLFAFSNVVMRVLRELPDATGMQAMQRINVVIVNPLFLLFFLGTTVASIAIVVLTLSASTPPATRALLWTAAACYLLGVVGVTMAFNIPLNNRLARNDPSSAHDMWPGYVARWLRWNHVRTAFAVLAVAAWAGALFELGQAAH
jgi:uncharacterized membrane protein